MPKFGVNRPKSKQDTAIWKCQNLQRNGHPNAFRHQEPITRSVQLPYSVCETGFSQVGLFLDKPLPRISSQKPIRRERLIINKLFMRITTSDNLLALQTNMADAFKGIFSWLLWQYFRR